MVQPPRGGRHRTPLTTHQPRASTRDHNPECRVAFGPQRTASRDAWRRTPRSSHNPRPRRRLHTPARRALCGRAPPCSPSKPTGVQRVQTDDVFLAFFFGCSKKLHFWDPHSSAMFQVRWWTQWRKRRWLQIAATPSQRRRDVSAGGAEGAQARSRWHPSAAGAVADAVLVR